MVPPEAFSTDWAHSSKPLCRGCDAGTQCASLSSMVLSCACASGAVASRMARLAVAARPRAMPQFVRDDGMVFPPKNSVGYGVGFRTNFGDSALEPHLCKGSPPA